jgi:hypothetical protein
LAKKVGTISGSQVPTQPRRKNTAYCGTSVACGGRMIVEISSMKRMPLNGKRKRAKP